MQIRMVSVVLHFLGILSTARGLSRADYPAQPDYHGQPEIQYGQQSMVSQLQGRQSGFQYEPQQMASQPMAAQPFVAQSMLAQPVSRGQSQLVAEHPYAMQPSVAQDANFESVPDYQSGDPKVKVSQIAALLSQDAAALSEAFHALDESQGMNYLRGNGMQQIPTMSALQMGASMYGISPEEQLMQQQQRQLLHKRQLEQWQQLQLQREQQMQELQQLQPYEEMMNVRGTGGNSTAEEDSAMGTASMLGVLSVFLVFFHADAELNFI